ENDALIGRVIGNWSIERKVGQGGMGAVYLARHTRLDRRVAIKVLLPEWSGQPLAVERFFNEARATTEIRDPHIVDVIDFGELPEAPYIVMEWLEGQPLSGVLRATGRFALPRMYHVARGIAQALRAAHGRGIVHRDLKPDNIFLVARQGDPDFVKVLD